MVDERILKLKSTAACDRFARNAEDHGRSDLAQAANRRAVELKAEEYGAETLAERECIAAVHAYERVLAEKHGRTTSAVRTWQMIRRHGIIPAVERAVDRPHETAGYTALLDMGLQDYAFESVIVRYPEVFSDEALERSKDRIRDWTTG